VYSSACRENEERKWKRGYIKKRKARMTTLPTVPPTMRIVLVLELVVVDDIEEVDVVEEPRWLKSIAADCKVVGGVVLSVLAVTCMLAVLCVGGVFAVLW
jgi:hypothetical protein